VLVNISNKGRDLALSMEEAALVTLNVKDIGRCRLVRIMASLARLRSIVWKRMIKKDPTYVKRYRSRLTEWRGQNTVVRVDKPTRIERARALGYREDGAFCIARVRVTKGTPFHSRPRAGRRPKKMGIAKITYAISDRKIAENRALRKFRNLKLLGSYLVGEDGRFKWFEIVLQRTQ
jgi:large subunit ribosomal protein L15e